MGPIRATLVTYLLSISACSHSGDISTKKLIDLNKNCIFTSITESGDKKTIDTGFSNNCFILKNSLGNNQTKHYSDIHATVAIVAGGTLDPNLEKYIKSYTIKDNCTNHTVGVLIKDSGELALSKYKDSESIYCANSIADEKVYWMFGHW